MLFWHQRNAHKINDRGNNDRDKSGSYVNAVHQKGNDYFKIKSRAKDYSSALNDIKVIVFPDRFEIEKLNIRVSFSSLNNHNKELLIRRIIGEISTTTGIPEDDILVIKCS